MSLLCLLKALADETRLRILNLLMETELCVCELEVLLNINQSNASRHLNKLSNANLVTYEKRAHYVYYRINKEMLDKYPFLKAILKEGLSEIKQCEKDREKLSIYKKSGITCEQLKEGKLAAYL
ncbi:ArsR/SmtB family transcription factor [Thermoanaerobacterium sp. DL9XJH110]|uniref:ArsR/SmtB family transcription factor n=1 Tax=Thermoanaerobacterium sp. DL9XJH110 TaxID=3386643 RepID=UPI003BB50E92